MSTNTADLRKFKESLQELSEQLQLEIQAKAANLDAAPEAILARRARVLSGDFKFFAYTYFSHHIRGEPSLFQAQFCDRYPKLLLSKSGSKEWWVAPRGEAKSSLLTKIGPVFITVLRLLQRPEVRAEINWQGEKPRNISYVLLLGAETSLPASLLEVVKTELTHNPALALDFPEVVGRGPKWNIGEIITRTGVKFKPYGAEQAIRGTFFNGDRPQVMLGDDLITDAEAKSTTERDNRWTWLTKAVEYIGPTDGTGTFLGVGTILHKDDPISRAKKTIGHLVHHFRAVVRFPINMHLWEACEALMLNDDKRYATVEAEAGRVATDADLPSWKFYQANKTAMDQGAIISWPGVRTLYHLMRQRAANRRAFATEMQGDGRDDDDKVFANITYWAQKSRDWLYFAGCDPSMGTSEKSDPSGIVVGGLDPSSKLLHIVEAVSKRRVPSKLESDLIEMQRRYRCRWIGFENNNAYEWARGSLIDNARKKGCSLPLIGVTATLPRAVRIDGLEPVICDRLAPGILFSQSTTQLLDELDSWPEASSSHHYDLLVALEILYMVSQTRGQAGTSGAQSTGKRAAANLMAGYGMARLAGFSLQQWLRLRLEIALHHLTVG